MKEVMKYRKIDTHDHPRFSLKDQIEIADRLGIEKLSISKPKLNRPGENENGPENPDKVKECNDEILQAMKNYPDRFIGFFTLNPFYDEKQVDICIEQLGEDRIFFCYVGSYYQAVGKILASNATELHRKKIF